MDTSQRSSLKLLKMKDLLQDLQKREALRETNEEKRQLSLGYCDTITPTSVPGNIKMELTSEKNPIFVANSFQGSSRQYERKIVADDGQELTQRISIGRAKGDKQAHGVLKQKHQEALYHLFNLWIQSGRKITQVGGRTRAVLETSAYQLAKAVCGSDSSKGYSYTRSVLRSLAHVPICIENAYTRTGISESELEFTVLNGFEWRTKTKKQENGVEQKDSSVYIQFSSIATKGLMHGHVKSFSMKTYLGLGKSKRRNGFLAKMLYSLLDHELAAKDTYHIRLEELFTRLGLHAYKYKSKRKEKLHQAIGDLNGKNIRAGTYCLNVHLRPSKDGNDYVLKAWRSQAVPTNQLSLFG